MRNRTKAIAIIAAALLMPALHAGEPAEGSEASAAAKPAAAPKGEKKKKELAAKAQAAEASGKCEYVTGSRIRHDPPVDCDNSAHAMRVFTSDELLGTGASDIGEALRKLDPRMQ